MANNFLLLVLALLVDRVIGDPDWLWKRLPHPVAGFGMVIAALDKAFNRESDPDRLRRRNGWLAIVVLLLASLLLGLTLDHALARLGVLGDIVEVLIVAVFLAQKSLAEHVAGVAEGLRRGGLDGGRKAVAKIVGRDPLTLDASGVCRAAIESLAENFSDGVVAPAFWYAILGLPGLIAYKMLNTADSMIAHKSPRHLEFGNGAARLDDAANWPAARLSALLIALAAWWRLGRGAGRRAFEQARSDAGMHRSPNAGWPEGAMAGALGLALSGPRSYGGMAVREPFINAAGRRNCDVDDIAGAVRLFWSASTVLSAAALVIGLLSIF